MTDREAIGQLKDYLSVRKSAYMTYLANGGRTDCGEEYFFDVIETAISALREREERNKGCECCKDLKPLLEHKDGVNFTIDGDAGHIVLFGGDIYEGTAFRKEIKIIFCPACGRPLKEES